MADCGRRERRLHGRCTLRVEKELLCASKPGSSISGWMQSTGQASTQAEPFDLDAWLGNCIRHIETPHNHDAL